MISISLRGLHAPADDITACHQHYASKSMLVLPSLLDHELCTHLQREINNVCWLQRLHEDNGEIGSEEVGQSDRALGLLAFLFCEPRLIETIRAITGDTSITKFKGRLFRINPALGHYDSWHDDNSSQRRVGMSVCLDATLCEGGGFELRNAQTLDIMGRVEQRRLGDATIFRIGDDLEHRVLPVKPGYVRIAYAGWFVSGEKNLQSHLAALKPAGA